MPLSTVEKRDKIFFETMIARDLKLSYSSGLKDFQVRAMEAIETGNDVFLIAASGTGKSLVQQAAFMFKKGKGKGKCANSITIHITPLKSLMDGQVAAEMQPRLILQQHSTH